jgi:hypothetical protein
MTISERIDKQQLTAERQTPDPRADQQLDSKDG